MNRDEDNLRILSVFYYVYASMQACFSFFPLIYVFMGGMFISFGEKYGNDPDAPPPELGWVFLIVGVVTVLIVLTIAILTFMSGKSIAARKRYTFIMVIAGLLCLQIPFGTVLGIFTFILLTKLQVRALFLNGEVIPGSTAALGMNNVR